MVSCGEVVFVDEPAGSVAPLDCGGWWAHGTDLLIGRLGGARFSERCVRGFKMPVR